MKTVYDLSVSHAGIQTIYLLFVHLNKTILRCNVFIRLLFEEEVLHQLKEAVWVESQEPGQELLIRSESNNVVNIDPPLERR
jgi:hypothetical protein